MCNKLYTHNKSKICQNPKCTGVSKKNVMLLQSVQSQATNLKDTAINTARYI